MKLKKIEHYSSIIEAIKQFEPCNPIIDSFYKGRKIKRNNESFHMFMYNQKTIILPNQGLLNRFYRGENSIFSSCKSSLNRINADEKIIAEIKKIEFIDIIKTFPEVVFAENDGHLVDYEALSQHYDMKSNVIDLTSDLIVAAFFATNYYDEEKNCFFPITSGEGVIWFYDMNIARDMNNNKFRFTGLQPFKRTEEQCAFSFYLSADEDFDEFAFKVQFTQNEVCSRFINALFMDSNNDCALFPNELISDISEELQSSKSILKEALYKYNKINKTSVSFDYFLSRGISVRNEPVYTLSAEEISRRDSRIKDKPFGEKFVTTRLTYKP